MTLIYDIRSRGERSEEETEPATTESKVTDFALGWPLCPAGHWARPRIRHLLAGLEHPLSGGCPGFESWSGHFKVL